jgi:hypothetical protein
MSINDLSNKKNRSNADLRRQIVRKTFPVSDDALSVIAAAETKSGSRRRENYTLFFYSQAY